jgi:Putative gypsy type transposon
MASSSAAVERQDELALDWWVRSTITEARLNGLVSKGLLQPRTEAEEWLVPGDEVVPNPPEGYVVSFAKFHERGFGVPAHRFVIGLFEWYGIALHHLNPNSIQHIAIFIALCEGYLGIEAHFDLWRYFFCVDLCKKAVKKVQVPVPVGCASIRLRRKNAAEYIPCRLPTSNKGWHPEWFYLKNTSAPSLPHHRLPEFNYQVFEDIPPQWSQWGVPTKDLRKIEPHLAAVKVLRERGLTAAGVVGAYHARRVAPLMARAFPLYGMVAGAPPEGTAMALGALPNSEIAQRIKEALEQVKDRSGAVVVPEYPVPRCPSMRPDLGFIDFVSVVSFPSSIVIYSPDSPADFVIVLLSQGPGIIMREHLPPLPRSAEERAANRALNQKLKAAADERKKKKQQRAAARHRGEDVDDSEEEEEDEGREAVPTEEEWVQLIDVEDSPSPAIGTGGEVGGGGLTAEETAVLDAVPYSAAVAGSGDGSGSSTLQAGGEGGGAEGAVPPAAGAATSAAVVVTPGGGVPPSAAQDAPTEDDPAAVPETTVAAVVATPTVAAAATTDASTAAEAVAPGSVAEATTAIVALPAPMPTPSPTPSIDPTPRPSTGGQAGQKRPSTPDVQGTSGGASKRRRPTVPRSV